ncbi:MAG TPA: hypothetical protein VFE56_07210, partial [Candidatus Binataceae bacterium]|nr:hypothetical protein [Candidatus Binataceae bacterium]
MATRSAAVIPPPVPQDAGVAAAPRPAPAPTVLHGAFDGARLLLWAERRPVTASPAALDRGKRKTTAAAPRLPYDAGDMDLISALTNSGVSSAQLRAETAVVWIPSQGATPLASSRLIADPPERPDRIDVRPWTISAVAVPWPAAIELLCGCAGRRTLIPGVIVGEDLAYWTTAMRLAATLTARQHFLPDIIEEEGAFAARWRPAPTHDGAQAMAQLAAAMPDACRAIGGVQAAPMAAAATILTRFVERIADQLARMNGLHPARKAHADFDSLDAQWLDALARPDPRLEGDRAAMLALKERVRSWWRPIAIGAASPFRLCFRLEEPEAIVTDSSDDVLYNSATADGDRPWHLRYLLQAHHDPSLLVLASKA